MNILQAKNRQLISNSLVTIIGGLLAIFVAYRIIRDQFDPVHEKIWTVRHHADHNERAAVIQEWTRLQSPPLEKLIPLCIKAIESDRSPLVRSQAVEFLAKVPANHSLAPSVCQTLIECLQDKDPGICSKAALGLASLKPTARQALPSLLAVLNAREKLARLEEKTKESPVGKRPFPFDPPPIKPWIQAAEAITAIVTNDVPEFSILKKLVQDPDQEVRRTIITSLAKYAQGRPEEWNFLTEFRANPSTEDRGVATATAFKLAFWPRFWNREKPPFPQFQETAIAWAIEDLHSNDPIAISRASSLIGNARPPAESVMPALLEAADLLNQFPQDNDKAYLAPFEYDGYNHSVESARSHLIQAFVSLDSLDARAIERLLQFADDPRWNHHYDFVPLLTKAGKVDRRAFTSLCRLATNSDTDALKALANFPNDAAECFPPLRKAYLSYGKDEFRCREIRNTLKELIRPGPLPKGFSSREELWKGDLAEQLVAVISSDPNTPQGMAIILKALEHTDLRIRGEAVVMLDLCDPAHTEGGLKALERVMKGDVSNDLRFWAKTVTENLLKRSGKVKPAASSPKSR